MELDMGLKGISVVMKYLIFIFNLLFVIVGIILISVGGVIKAEYANYVWFLDNRFFSVPALLIATGVIIFVVAFFGCCGVVKENYCMVLTFSLLLIVIFILELSAGIAGYVLRDNAEQFLVGKLYASMDHYNATGGSSVVWDNTQRLFGCCGVVNASDWSDRYKQQGERLPVSCCHLVVQQWGGDPCTVRSGNLNEPGCLGALKVFVAGHAATLGGIGIGIAVIQLLGLVFACSLTKNFRKRDVSV
ncbi:CD63 antigen-like [Bacillus rossius redtenbacheri]|uniref:CD63 antigen-like n=1 Tax=Bacillus rossius redtenbacheri TaxID=93214 RepID=UPI002FDDD858